LLSETSREDAGLWAQQLRAWSGDGVAGYARRLSSPGLLRLTLRPALHAALGAFSVGHREEEDNAEPRPPQRLAVRCDWVAAWLFPTGLGFLLLRLRLADEQAHLSQLIQLGKLLRQVLPAGRGARQAVLQLPGGEEFTVRDLMEFLTRGMATP